MLFVVLIAGNRCFEEKGWVAIPCEGILYYIDGPGAGQEAPPPPVLKSGKKRKVPSAPSKYDTQDETDLLLISSESLDADPMTTNESTTTPQLSTPPTKKRKTEHTTM
eukprot:TRINITY_DN2921_c0_g1_i1.p1 TRINITY_DN2921_c0_g1~~TRINITY_DN2921_c0_g1_i1.p1  ORF type:complete len:108 (-),score=16.20 TRINITY_DN2921_c0_g1_i1:83-406(-)